MSIQKNLITLCFATVFTLGLAACGGGGGAPVSDMDGPDMDGDGSLEGKYIPSGTTFTLPAGLVDDITVSVEEGVTVPVGDVGTFECVTGPCTVDIADDVVMTTGVIKVVSLADGLPAEALTALADVAEDAPAGPTPEEMAAAATKAAATKVTAIDKEAGQGTDGGLGGSDVGTVTVAIKRDRDGTTVEIKDSANAGDDDPKFIMQDVDLGEGRTMHVRTMPENDDGEVVEEVVIVKTDIKAPKATPFAQVKSSAGVPTQMLNARDLDHRTDGDDKDGDLNNDFTAHKVEAGEKNVNLKKIKSAAFTAGAAGKLKFDSNNKSTQDTDEAFESEGTYNGAMGTYRCSGDVGCTVTLNAKGEITAISEKAWIFTPDPGAKSDVADANYLHYGFWLMKTTKDGATTYNEVETFAGSNLEASTAEDLGTVRGTASYEGGSVGVYVKNVLDDQANITSATSGHFSADVELTANFGGDNVPANDMFTIGGKITDFVLSGGEENDWAVKLGLADFSTRVGEPGKSEPGEVFEKTFGGVTTGDSTALAGSWSGAFHGPTPVTAATDDDKEAPVAPGTVVGEFNANFTNGTAAGGFGAKKQ